MGRSLYWYIGSLYILTNTYTTALTTKQVAKKVLFPSLFERAHSNITNKDDLKVLLSDKLSGDGQIFQV